MLLFAQKSSTVFSAFVEMLGVKYTQSYADKLYHEHPYKYSFFGLSKMLSEYNIMNVGVKCIRKKESLNSLETPFIAHAGNEFVLVYKKDENNISYLWQGKHIRIPLDDFIEIWSGAVLLAETDEKSIEPDYRQNRKKEWVDKAKVYLLCLLMISISLFIGVSKGLFFNWGLILSLILNLIGGYVCLLLLMKQMHIHSDYADKLCSLFKKSDCNNVLESEDAKLWGLVGWSEIGFSYFVSNLIIVLWFPQFMFYLSVIGCFTLCFSFWSVWYQKVKVRQWCPLCLVIQLLFWLLFFVNLQGGYFAMPRLMVESVFLVGCIYLFPLLIVSVSYPYLEASRRVRNLIQEMGSLKMRDAVISGLLQEQAYYEVSEADSQLVFGNPEAAIRVTILTNPHCEPCGAMHRRVNNLLAKTGNKVCIQYILSSFNEELEVSNKFLIAAYLNSPKEKAEKIFDEWFEKGKYRKEEFFKRYPQNMDNSLIEVEFNNHKSWKEQAGIAATPTILVNGYMLPRDYRIEDIEYFIDLDVNSIRIAKP